METRHLQAMVNYKRPAAGRHFRQALRELMKTAISAGYRRDDPTQGVTLISTRTSGYHTWTEDEIARFESAYPPESRERLALALLLYTGQRRGDVCRMGRQHVEDGFIHVRQEKTGTVLEIPIHPALQAVLAAHALGNLTFLVTEWGGPFSSAYFGNWFRKRVRAAGLPERCSAHGLRKAASRRLAEAGSSAMQIAAITGHTSLKEVERYVKAAAQRKLALAAIRNISKASAPEEGTQVEQKLSNLDGRLDNSRRK